MAPYLFILDKVLSLNLEKNFKSLLFLLGAKYAKKQPK